MSAEEASHVIVSNSSDADADADVRAFSDVVRSLPSDAVRDLRSRGVCNRCIIRSFGVAEPVSPRPLLLQSIFSWLVGVPEDSNGSLVNGGPEEKKDLSSQPAYEDPEYRPAVCSICLGILQFCCMDNNTSMVKNNASNELAASIAQRVKQEAHEIDRFSLEVSIPQCIMEKERRFLSLVSRNNNELPEGSHSERISLKDALKKLLATPLEMLLGVKYGQGPFHIRLTYSEPSEIVESPIDGGHDSKRRKTGVNNGSDTAVSSVFSNTGCDTTGEVPAVSETPFNGFLRDQSSACSNLSQKKVQKPCCLSIHCYRDPIYFGGRYLKYARNVSQTCWMIDEERMGEASVEEIISGHILSACRGDKYKFHAAGREDIDVRMLGSGRPFLVEIQNARHVPSDGMVKEIEEKINRPRNKLVGVKNLKLVGSQGWALLREGEAEKQKEYAALVWISRPLEDNDLLSVSSARDMQIMQRTPIRVLHRRSPLEREKIIHWMKIEKIAGSSQYFILHLCTQAGTYIKEFVHGDLGRTYPSIGSMLGCRAEILQLDVTDVKMDCFWPDKDIEGHERGIGQSSNSTSFAGACPST